MTTYRTILIALISLYLSACSSLIVNHDYNQQTDFSKFKSYDWLPFAENMKNVDEFNRARFVTAVENNLDTKGLIHNSTKPDLKIAVHFGKQR